MLVVNVVLLWATFVAVYIEHRDAMFTINSYAALLQIEANSQTIASFPIPLAADSVLLVPLPMQALFACRKPVLLS